MHDSAYHWLQQIRANHSFQSPVLEIGSIDINGSARELWGTLQPYIGVDIVDGKNVDCVVDIRDWDIINNRYNHPYLHYDFRTIICTEVLEHVEPSSIINAMWLYMGDTCKVVITAASTKRKSHSADGSPELKVDEYYKNVHPTTLLSLLNNPPIYIECISVDVIINNDSSDVYAFAEYRRVL